MKKLLLVYVATFIMYLGAYTQSSISLKKQKNNAIAFTENKGQVHDQNYVPRPDVLYGVMAGNMAVHIKKTGVSYQLYRVDSYKDMKNPKTNEVQKEIDQQTIYRIDLTWLNATTNFAKTEDKTLPGYVNYYLASCPDGALNVKSYEGVHLNNLYKGIDLHYYEKNGELKHDYIVAPHADYKQIQLKVEGAEITVNEDGSLLLHTSLGKVQEGIPIVYQHGKRLKAAWIIKNNTLSFEIDNYNPNYELIIDPVTHLWGTYYGGTGNDAVYSCATDASGNVYMTGFSESNTGTVIATTGGHQSSFGGFADAFLVKFNSSGVRQWGTYYGGTGIDAGYSCATDASGNVYMAGYADSNTSTVIATVGSHQSAQGGNRDAFLAKFNSNGVRQWGTYYGGTGVDYGFSCSTDTSGNVYMAGQTNSNSFTVIATTGSHQSSIGLSDDAFLVKFNSSGVRQWGTYYGAIGVERGYSCATDVAGNVYMAGSTASSFGTVIATAGSHQSAVGAGDDAFLVKFNSNGVRQWGTYYGGTGNDNGRSCATDAAGNVYVAGTTASNFSTVIATTGSHQSVFGVGYDAFLVKFNSSGVRQWGTYYGGTGNDNGSSCATDAAGNVYMAGTTASNFSTVIATASSHQSAHGSGTNDAFLVKFNSSGLRLWGTYYGGTGSDNGSACATDPPGNIYIAGETTSNTGTVIASIGSHQNTHGGSFDAFLVKFADCSVLSQPSAISGAGFVCFGTSQTYSVINDPSAITYTWSLPGGWIGSSFTNTISATAGASGIFTVTTNDACNSSPQQTFAVTVNPLPTISVNSGTICSGNSFTISPGGAMTYTIEGGSMVVLPTANTSYTVSGTSTAGCVSANSATSNVTVNPLPTITVNSGSICSGSSFTISPSGANTYTIQGGSTVVSPNANSNYTVSGTSAHGCLSASSATSSVTVNTTPTITVNSGSICSGSSFTISPNGANIYTIQGGNAVVSPSINTTYTVVATSTAGCVSANTATSTVIVNATPTVSVNNSSICLRASFTLSPTGANTYTFEGGSAIVSPTASTSYTIVGTSMAGCVSASFATAIVNVNPLPTVGASTSNTLICEGESATLTASGASSYTFNPGSTGTSIIITPSITLTYTVTGIDANGCQNTASITQNVDECSGILNNSIFNSKIHFYPNPNNGVFNLVLDTDYHITITNALGQSVYDANLSSGEHQLNLVGISKGVYVITVLNFKGSENIKLIKE